jgi:hypothetical protein
MMSAVPLLDASAKPAPAKHSPVVTAPIRHITTIKTVDPITTDKSITYKSFASDPLFATGGPTSSDISQGELGDCYLLATLSSVVKTDPSLIEKDIVSDGNGIYSITFGGPKGTTINVNADLPVFSNGQVAYAQLGNQDSLWVALMEKAYVQYDSPKTDSYASIEGGWMSQAFSALGVKSSSIYTASSASALLTTLAADLKAGDFTTFGTVSRLPSGSPLVANHAYEVDSVTLNASGTPTSVTLRNPWGNAVADDGLITVTPQQAYTAFTGAVMAHA